MIRTFDGVQNSYWLILVVVQARQLGVKINKRQKQWTVSVKSKHQDTARTDMQSRFK